MYLDDVLVASPSAEQHTRDLRQLFSALKAYGLVLNEGKCTFGVAEIKFLGHMVSSQGIAPLPCKVAAVQRFQQPQTVKSLQRFLGLVNFYRRFLPGIAATMRPLMDALAGRPRQLHWSDAMTSAFVQTKQRLAAATLLVHPVADAELRVSTDASSRAIAGAIHQVIRGQQQPLGFFSRRTSATESRYSAYDLELLAVYSTILKFRHVLEGRRFGIYTDQKPLTSAFFKARDPVSYHQRQQLAFISEFATDILHVPGVENVVADALTRQYDDERASAIVHAVVHNLTDVDLSELAAEQPSIKDQQPSSLRLEKIQFAGVDQAVICDTSLGRPRVLVPDARRRRVFEAVHGLSHRSGKTTLAMLARDYVWPKMRQDVLRWAKECKACQASKVTVHTKPPIIPIPVPTSRFEHVHVDLVGPFAPDQGFKYIFTIVDRTTKWPEAIPIADTTSETVLQTFLDHWISRFGIPATVTSDRGSQFTSEAWRKTLKGLGVNVSTSYHPQANGAVERFHRTLKDSLRCAIRASKSWSRSLPWVLLGVRNAPKGDSATSTAEVVYGTPLRIPGCCFQSKQGKIRTVKEELEGARSNVANFMPETLDLRQFKESPFVAKALRTTEFVYVRDDRLGKPCLAPRYTGPYRVLSKDWQNNTFILDLGKREDTVSLSRLKAASIPAVAT